LGAAPSLINEASLFAGDLARQRAFDSILGHVNGHGVACFSAPCPFGDSQRATAGENRLILSRMAGKLSKREKNSRILSRMARKLSKREKNCRILSRMAGKLSKREKNCLFLSRTAEPSVVREKCILLCPRHLAISSAGKNPHLELRSGWPPASYAPQLTVWN
jgi:hypothetical protein